MILCREDILRSYEKGEIVIDPFDMRLVNPNSVDVRFGKTLFRMKSTYGIRDLYNPHDELWEQVLPVPARQIREGGIDGLFQGGGKETGFVRIVDDEQRFVV